MLIRRAALTLRIEAILLFFLALVLLANPSIATRYLGISPSHSVPELLWTFRVLGAALLLPALLAPLVAAFAGERGLRQAASGLAFISVGLGVVTLFAPGGITARALSVAAVWFLFALLYFYALRGRGRNR